MVFEQLTLGNKNWCRDAGCMKLTSSFCFHGSFRKDDLPGSDRLLLVSHDYYGNLVSSFVKTSKYHQHTVFSKHSPNFHVMLLLVMFSE